MLKLANKRGINGLETRRLSYVNLFMKNAIEEGIIYMNILNRPIIGKSQCKNDAECNRLYNMRKIF